MNQSRKQRNMLFFAPNFKGVQCINSESLRKAHYYCNIISWSIVQTGHLHKFIEQLIKNEILTLIVDFN